jgi:uncharacterized protein YjdB
MTAKEVFMKNTFKLIGIIAFVVVIGFSFPSCGDSDSSSGGGNVTNEKAMYTSIDGEGNVYELTITPKSDKAAYEPKAGDLFKLVITFVNGTMKTSEGTVNNEVKSGSTTTVTLSVSEISFTVSISTVTDDISVMTDITGTIPITSSDDDDTSPVIIEEVTLAPQVENGSKAVIGVILNKTAIDLDVGDTEILFATVLPSSAANKNGTWSSSDTSIVSVSSSGAVTAMATGNVIITVTTADGRKTATCYVTVSASEVPVTGVSLDRTTLSLTVGESENLSATVLPSNATNKNVTWSSSADGISTVSSNGTVTGIAAGSATITVTTEDGGEMAICSVTVTSGSGGELTTTSLASYLATLSPNNTSSPYNIALKVSSAGQIDTIKTTLQGAPDKYVKLDLSGSSITTIPNSAFYIGGPSMITINTLIEIIIPSGVTSIGRDAFFKCKNLSNVTIPDGVTSIGEFAFSECRSFSNLIIPDSVTRIERSAFENTGITSVNIPNGVTSIERQVFLQCYNLTSVIIPNSVTSIGYEAFYYCTSLTNITIPNSVTSIGEQAFYNCKSFTSVTISDSVKSIGEMAFSVCDNLTSVTFQGTISSSRFSYTFSGNLRDKFYETDKANGTPGKYIREIGGYYWALQP